MPAVTTLPPFGVLILTLSVYLTALAITLAVGLDPAIGMAG